MEIQFTCLIDRGLYLRMCWLHNLPSLAWIMGRGVVILAAIGFIAYSLLAQPIETGMALAAGLVVFIAAEPFWNPLFKLLTEYNNQPEIAQPVPGTITEAGIGFRPNKLLSFFTWDRFIRVKRAKDLVLLYMPGDVYYVFTPAFFQQYAGDWQEFLKLLEKAKIKG
jgi:hypothetical protein